MIEGILIGLQTALTFQNLVDGDGRLSGRDLYRHVARSRPNVGHCADDPDRHQLRPGCGHHSDGGGLLRRDLRRLDLVDPDQCARRSIHRGHRPSTATPWPSGAQAGKALAIAAYSSFCRRGDRRDPSAGRCAVSGLGVTGLPVDGLFRPDGARPHRRRRLRRQGQCAQGAADDGGRADALHGRDRQERWARRASPSG